MRSSERGSGCTVYLIGNAHVDPVWLWRWPEGWQAVRATFRSALDRMAEDPDFVFTASSAAHHHWVELADPAMFEEIRRRVEEGRWALAGGWWVQPDCNLPCGEALVRQGLLGQGYFESRFGRLARVGYNVDSFGHASTLPAILAGQGMDSYVFFRPEPGREMALPEGGVFWWEAPDGSRVLAARPPLIYASAPEEDLRARVARALAELPSGRRSTALFYGVGDHGGGPTRAALAALHEVAAEGAEAGGPQLLFSSLEPWFDQLRSAEAGACPVVIGGLQHHARGCYSALVEAKLADRRATHSLLVAERWLTAAREALGRSIEPGAAAGLARGWRRVLFNQFHDILAGSCIEPAWEDALRDYQWAEAEAAQRVVEVLQWIAARTDTERGLGPDLQPLLVFNPTPWRRPLLVEHELSLTPGAAAQFVGPDGEPLPAQELPAHALALGRRRYLVAVTCPGLGYCRVAVRVTVPPARTPPVSPPEGTDPGVREGTDPGVAEGTDPGVAARATGSGPGSAGDSWLAWPDGAGVRMRWVVRRDESDTWSHGVARHDGPVLGVVAGQPILGVAGPLFREAGMLGEVPGLGAALQVRVRSYRDRPEREVSIDVDWRVPQAVLQWELDLGTALERVDVAEPYGRTEWPADGEEHPCHHWIAARCRDGRALAVVNEGHAGWSADGTCLRITLLRSPFFAHHAPHAPDPTQEHRYQAMGRHRFQFRILCAQGGPDYPLLERLAWELGEPGCAIEEYRHRGMLPFVLGLWDTSRAGGGIPTVWKPAERDAGAVLRGFEIAGARGSIEPPGCYALARPLELGARAIASWRLRLEGQEAYAEPVDLLERAGPARPARAAANWHDAGGSSSVDSIGANSANEETAAHDGTGSG